MSAWPSQGATFPAIRRWLAALGRWRPLLSTETLILGTALFFTLACNGLFWRSAMAAHPGDPRLAAALFLILLGAHALLLGLLVWRWNARAMTALLLVTAALAAHYMGRYHLYLDADMLRNVLATDRKESRELLSVTLLPSLALLAAVPIALLWRLRLRRPGWRRALAQRTGLLLAALALLAGGTMLAFQDVSSLLRNQREIRYLATPANVLVGLPRALRSGAADHQARLPIGADAHAAARATTARPRLLVIVVGETARAANWGLNGYRRQTTPELAATGVINFSDMHACGTATEISLPCMFSPWGRHAYDAARIRGHQSLLHVIEHAGISTLWRDNQSGCKGVCDGLATERLDDAHVPEWCSGGRCMDGILLQDLPARVRAHRGDRVVVLHQLGNHGPGYHARHPAAFRRFVPTCDSDDLGDCSREQIVNSYDNALLYTDHVLASTIRALAGMDDYDTALLYVSDHGESLGENGLYLHGIPYAIAPREQTGVPMVMWFSAGFAADRGLDLACLRDRATRRAEHDDLFSSVLGLLRIQTGLYERGRDLFAGCAPPA